MSVLVYFHGDLEAAKAAAPDAEVRRFANAKFWTGELEVSGLRRLKSLADVPVYFDEVIVSAGVLPRVREEIREAYADVGVDVRSLAAGEAKAKAPKAKTLDDYGWTLKSSPEEYIKRYPNGAKRALALKIIKGIGG